MSKFRTMTTVAMFALLLGLGACNMYVVDFENRLPNGSVLTPKTELAAEPPEPLEPLEGSQTIAFMDSTTAQLEGCRVITGMRLSHIGKFDDGLTKLRNTAVRINANRIIPLRFVESPVTGAPHHFSAKMVRCPDQTPEVQNG